VQVAVILAQAVVITGVAVVRKVGSLKAVRPVDLKPEAQVGRLAAVAVKIRILGRDCAGVETIALFMRQAQGVVKAAAGAAEAGVQFAGVVSTKTHACEWRKAVFTAFGENLDHAAQRVRAINRASGTAQHFNAVNQCQRNTLPWRASGGLRVHPHAVYINSSETRLGAAQKHTGGGGGAAVA
jgi:hypothetical protein